MACRVVDGEGVGEGGEAVLLMEPLRDAAVTEEAGVVLCVKEEEILGDAVND